MVLKSIINAGLLLALSGCSNNEPTGPVVGDGTHTGNAIVSGHLYKAGGPAIGAKVFFVPVSHNPNPAPLPKAFTATDTVTTDSSGLYGTNDLDSGTYNVFGVGTDGHLSLLDSVHVTGDSQVVPPDTLKLPGSLTSTIKMQGRDDPASVLIMPFGTFIKPDPTPSTGVFTLPNLAEGWYSIRFMSVLDRYEKLDTTFEIKAGQPLVLDSIVLPLKIPTPTGLTISYDTLKQVVTLSWDKMDTSRVKGYNAYRQRIDTAEVKLNALPLLDTFYVDSTGIQDQTYIYSVVAVDFENKEGIRTVGDSVIFVSKFVLMNKLDTTLIKNPFGIKTSENGMIYILDYDKKNIQIYDSNYAFARAINCSLLVEPKYFDFDSNGFLYVADRFGVSKYDTSGLFINTVASWEPVDTKYLTIVDANLFVSNRKIRKYSLDGALVWEDSLGLTARGLWVYNSQLYMCDANASNIKIFTMDGAQVDQWSLGLNEPAGPQLIIQDKQSDFYISAVNLPALSSRNAIFIYDSNKTYKGCLNLDDTVKGMAIYGRYLLLSIGNQVRIYAMR